MKYSYLILFFLFPLAVFSQSKKNVVSVNYFNDLSVGNRIFKSTFPFFGENILVMNRDVYNFSIQVEYERKLNDNMNTFFSINYAQRNFKSEIILEGNLLQFFNKALIQKLSFINYNFGLKKYFGKINVFQFYGKAGFGIGKSCHKPNSFFMTTFEDKLYHVFFGFGMNREIRNNLKWKVEININHSLNPIIKEFKESKIQVLSLGFGLKYEF